MPAVRILPAIVAFALCALPVFAFHDGGVAACSGCHTMHASQDGQPGPGWTPGGNPDLLKYGNATDTCLRCHGARGQFAGGLGFGPGGDFYWLTRTFTWMADGGSAVSAGASHGHNVVSPANGVEADPVLPHAPGGDFLSNRLGCTSCHDPHGNRNFRMLYDATLGPAYGDNQRYAFAADAPSAKGKAGTTLVGGGANETDAQHTVYKDGVDAWCANCHPAMHDPSGATFVHPTGALLTTAIIDNYNRYVSTGDPDGGSAEMSYSGLVPFEDVSIDLETVNPSNATAGPAAGDKVMCLTCHRAHASPFADAGRWDFTATFLAADTHPQTGDGGASSADVANRYYGRTFDLSQRSLCNKCHAQDLGDAPSPAPQQAGQSKPRGIWDLDPPGTDRGN